MGGCDVLGAADVPDRTLLAMVADQVGGPGERIDSLGTIEDVVVLAYAAGCEHDEDTVRRAHAILMFAFTGLSAVPFDLLETTPAPELAPLAAERAAATRFSLDLLDATSRGRSTWARSMPG